MRHFLSPIHSHIGLKRNAALKQYGNWLCAHNSEQSKLANEQQEERPMKNTLKT